MVLCVTKVLHEFGHGLSCKHFGGECHEMGVMILVLTPCLYCNVSDSWMLPNKWHRAAIGAAGMYVELVLAPSPRSLWWSSEPGLLNNLCLNVMFVCSVSTLVFNANPLLRYDGYYILADLTEIPNLRQKATTILSRKMGDWCLGLEQPEDPFLPQRNQIFFALYSVASAVYRWVVVFSILWFLYKIFQPYGLQVIGQMIALASLWGLVVMPLYQVGKFFYVPGRLDKVKKTRMFASLGILVAVVLAVLFLPLPHSVMATLEIQPRDAVQVWVDVPGGGKLVAVYVKPGQHVTKGQKLALLENIDLEQEIEKLHGQQQQFEAQLQNLRREGLDDPRAAAQIPEVEKALENIENQLAEKRRDRRRLCLAAPCDGTVLPPPATAAHDDPEGQLPTWSGTPLDPQNLGAYLREGPHSESVMFCQIGDPAKLQANLVIDQGDMEFDPTRGKRSTSSWTSCRTTRSTAVSPRSPTPRSRSVRSCSRRRRAGTWPPRPIRRPAPSSRRALPTRRMPRWRTPRACCVWTCAAGRRSMPSGCRWASGSGGWSPTRSISSCKPPARNSLGTVPIFVRRKWDCPLPETRPVSVRGPSGSADASPRRPSWPALGRQAASPTAGRPRIARPRT